MGTPMGLGSRCELTARGQGTLRRCRGRVQQPGTGGGGGLAPLVVPPPNMFALAFLIWRFVFLRFCSSSFARAGANLGHRSREGQRLGLGRQVCARPARVDRGGGRSLASAPKHSSANARTFTKRKLRHLISKFSIIPTERAAACDVRRKRVATFASQNADRLFHPGLSTPETKCF